MVGLDAAGEEQIKTKCHNIFHNIYFFIFWLGKTTILYKLKLGEIVTTIPTIGKYSSIFSWFNQ